LEGQVARITKEDLKKIKKNINFKGTIQRGIRWNPSRRDKALDRAWAKKVGERIAKETP
jgi:hypothetical protein